MQGLEQAQGAAEDTAQQLIAQHQRDLQQLAARHALQKEELGQSHAAERERLTARHVQELERVQVQLERQQRVYQQRQDLLDAEMSARVHVTEDALLGYVAVIAASVHDGQAALHQNLADSQAFLAMQQSQMQLLQQQVCPWLWCVVSLPVSVAMSVCW